MVSENDSASAPKGKPMVPGRLPLSMREETVQLISVYCGCWGAATLAARSHLPPTVASSKKSGSHRGGRIFCRVTIYGLEFIREKSKQGQNQCGKILRPCLLLPGRVSTWVVQGSPISSPTKQHSTTAPKRVNLVRFTRGNRSTTPVMIVSTCTI